MFRTVSIQLRRINASVLVTFLAGLTSCSLGGIGVGGGSGVPAPNEARPSGTAISSGSFSGLNGQTVSGTAYIFQNSATYTLRLESLSAPSGVPLQAQVFTTSSPTAVFSVTLTFHSGNQNFSFTTTPGSKFTSVQLINPFVQGSTNIYGSALLVQIQ